MVSERQSVMAKNFRSSDPYSRLDDDSEVAYVDRIARDDFALGQDYDEKPADTLVCQRCGGDKFLVGQGHCLTVIKCPSCGWEASIHDG